MDTGDINPGWPIDVEATASYNGIDFTAAIQQQRPALGIVGNILYVGIWEHGGLQSLSWLARRRADRQSGQRNSMGCGHRHRTAVPYGESAASPAMGRTRLLPLVTPSVPQNWQGGEAVIRFQPGPIFSGSPADYWVPENWLILDNFDADLGSSGPLLVDVPDATPSHLVVALGKDRNAYLVNRDNLGGISAPIAVSQVASSTILQAAVTYRTKQSTYVAFRANNDGNTVLSAFRITATNPPAIASGWNVNRGAGGCGSPFVTSTDGTNNMIVWVVGTEDHLTAGDQRLHGYDGDTGAVVYDGGGPNELMAGTHYYSTTGIVARGRIYVAGDNKVYAFAVPGGTPTPTPTTTPTVTPTTTPTPTVTPTVTPTPTATPTARPTPTPRPRPNPPPRPTPPR